MGDYSHLRALEVSTQTTSEFPLDQITVNGVSPVLIVVPATDANKPYFNTLLKRAGKAARVIKRGAINSGMIDDNRDQDKELFSKHVIIGWRDQVGADGEEIPFSKQECADFLSCLPNWLFDDLRTYCSDPANFTEGIDIEVTAKN